MPLQDSDNFIIGRGTDSYKITYEDLKDDLNYVPPPVLNLQVGKGSISPSVNLEEGDTLTGSATVTDAENPVVVHVWELDGVEAQRGSEATYVADAGQVRYRKEVTDDNNSSAVIGEWSDAVTVAEIVDDTVPNATMHGLRFDSGRNTYLQNGNDYDGISPLSISFWVKPTRTSGYIFQVGDNAIGSSYTASGLYVQSGTSSEINMLVPSANVPLNTWTHILITNDLSNWKVYTNGVEAVSAPTTSADKYAPRALTRIGLAAQNTSSPGNSYLSEFYYVTDQTLTPQDFGKFFEPNKWGPLDSSKVKENIGFKESPADTAPNYDQKWSDGTDASTWDQPITNLFDGDLSTRAYAKGAGATCTWDPITANKSIRVYGYTSGTSDWQLIIDGSNVDVPLPTSDPGDWVEMPVTYPCQLSGVYNNSIASARAIEVDGRILIDGPADNSQVWSNNVTGDVRSDKPPSLAFDGDESTYINAATPPSDGSTSITFNFDPGLPSGQTEFLASASLNYTSYTKLEINGVDRTDAVFGSHGSDTDLPKQYWTLSTADGSDIDSVTVYTGRDNNVFDGIDVYAFKVDGKILIDGVPEWNTSQVWSESGGSLQYGSWKYAFDGELPNPPTVNNTAFNDAVSGASTVTFNPPLSGNLRVWASSDTITSNNPSTIISLSDGTSKTLTNGSDAIGWQNFGAVSSITSLTITAAGSTNGTMLGGVELDEELLVDGGSFGANGFHLPFDPAAGIGNDASGQDNHFSDQNFILGTIENPGTSTTTGVIEAGYPIENAFDGDLSTYTRPGGNEEAQVDFTTSFDNLTSLRFYVKNGSSHAYLHENLFKVNGVDYSRGVTTTLQWVSISETTLSSFSMKSNGTNAVPYVYAIEVNGSIITNSGVFLGQDTVLDTPMNNYAVLETGSNGNLVATAAGTNLTYVGEAGTDYYYEADGVGATHTGGSAFSSTDGVAYNFGQQPFAETPTVEGRLYQTWTQWARTALGYAVDRIAKLEQRNLQLEALVEEARTRLAALELNEISDDAVDTALITLIGNINDRLTALENN